jgi:ribosome biogenesis protein MAK21
MLIDFCFKLFFHQYFTRKNDKEKAKAAKVGKRKGDEEISSKDDQEEDDEEMDGPGKASSDDAGVEVATDDKGDSDADEAEIWKVFVFKSSFW